MPSVFGESAGFKIVKLSNVALLQRIGLIVQLGAIQNPAKMCVLVIAILTWEMTVSQSKQGLKIRTKELLVKISRLQIARWSMDTEGSC